MQVEFPLNASGEIGFLNEGFWGMNVQPQKYNASFYLLANGPFDAANLTTVNVSLRSNLTEDIWVSQSIKVRDAISDMTYAHLQAELSPEVTAPNSNNSFAITFNGTEVAGKTLYCSLISLIPETYNDRPNGMRKDLAEHIKNLNPRFLRFPGGNNLEGVSISTRWQWNQTIGPLMNRPGRPGNWEYYNTDGFGLLEYLEWTDDMQLERVLGIYAGYSLAVSGAEGSSYPQEAMPEILQSALDELEYCMGDSSTFYGALRAKHGHPEPFSINLLEIGNEDFFSSTYPSRFQYLLDGIKERYPDMTFISTALDENEDYTIAIPPGNNYDFHPYREPSFFLESFDTFDNWQAAKNLTDVTISVLEYSVVQVDEPTGG